MRIVGGKFRGKTITAPSGLATRPTTDRVRENLFNILHSRIDFEGIRVLDLFAGTGALGMEALSRGASFCLFVENAGPARAAIRTNMETLALNGVSKLYRRDATRLGDPGAIEKFDLVFADPPYSRSLGEKAAKALVEQCWLNDNAILMLEEAKGSMPEKLEGFDCIDARTYGDTSVALFEYAG